MASYIPNGVARDVISSVVTDAEDAVLGPMVLQSLAASLHLVEQQRPKSAPEARISAALRIHATLRDGMPALGPMPALDTHRLGTALRLAEQFHGRSTPATTRLQAALAIYAAAASKSLSGQS